MFTVAKSSLTFITQNILSSVGNLPVLCQVLKNTGVNGTFAPGPDLGCSLWSSYLSDEQQMEMEGAWDMPRGLGVVSMWLGSWRGSPAP